MIKYYETVNNIHYCVLIAYDIPTLSKHLDWIGLMAYDYHGHWDQETGHVAPLYFNEDDRLPDFNAVC